MGDTEQHVATDNNSPGILHVSYTTEIPGHDPGQHVTNTERQSMMANYGTALQEGEAMRFDTAQQLIEYQAAHRGAGGAGVIYGVSSFDTNNEGGLSPFDDALLEAAFVNEMNEAMRFNNEETRYTLGEGTAQYLQSLGIDPNYLHTTGSVTRDFESIDPHLGDAGVTDYDHVYIEHRSGAGLEYNTTVGPLPLTATTAAFIPGQEADNTGTDVGGGALIIAGAGTLASAGAMGYASYQGLAALGGGGAALAPTAGGVTGAMMGFNSAGAVTELNPLSVGAGGGMAGSNAAAGTIGGTAAGGAGAEMPMYSELNPMFSGGGAAGPPATNPSAAGLRYRGPTANQVSTLLRSGGTAATGMAGGAVATGETLAAGTTIATGAGIVGVAAILAGVAIVASGDDDTPPEASGHVVYNAGAGGTPDPLSNVNYGQAEANYMNNMDQVYLQNGATPEQMTTIHEYYAAALDTSNNDPGVRAGFNDLHEQYGMDLQQKSAEEGAGVDTGGHTASSGGGDAGGTDGTQADTGGHTADSGGGDGGTTGGDDDRHTANTGGGDTGDGTGGNDGGTGLPTGGGGGLPPPTGDDGNPIIDPINPLVDPTNPFNPYEPDLDPLHPAAFPGTYDDNNYRGTGYSYFAFMSLPRWLQLKLLKGKRLDDDDY